MTATDAMASLARYERRVCVRWNRVRSRVLLRALVLVSRAGDGWTWLALALLMPLVYGPGEWPLLARLALVLALCFPTYALLKRGLARPRPFAAEAEVVAWAMPPDQYAFPSGHTMHAVAFSIVLIRFHPELAWLLVPFTAVVSLSRVVLGLHYPSDVLAGGVLGAGAGGLVAGLTS
jgi:undecaprenyl-diphosphatase